MDQAFDVSKLLVSRRVTRSISDLLQQQLKSHLATMTPLLEPRLVFGKHVRSSTKLSAAGDDASFEELRGLYTSLAGQSGFSMPKEL